MSSNRTKTPAAQISATLDQIQVAVAPVNLNSNPIQNLADGTNPQDAATLANLANAISGADHFRGGYDASTNLFPATGGSGTAGAIVAGDYWEITIAGTLGIIAVTPGDNVTALVGTPGQTAANWNPTQSALGYVAENVANKNQPNGYAGLDSSGRVIGDGSQLTNMTSSQVGLGNVNNTSDANKPISTATQTALNAKQDLVPTPIANDFVITDGSGQGQDSGLSHTTSVNSSSTNVQIPDALAVYNAIAAATPAPINFADNEIPNGTIDGNNTTFTLVNAPVGFSLQLALNGSEQYDQALNAPTADYTISGTTITMLNAPNTGDTLIANYRY